MMKLWCYLMFGMMLNAMQWQLLHGNYWWTCADIVLVYLMAESVASYKKGDGSWTRLFQSIIVTVVMWIFPFVYRIVAQSFREAIAELNHQLALTREDLIERLESSDYEVNRLQEQNLRILRGEFTQICSYCGFEFPAEGEYSWEDLQAHILVCPHHPVGKLTTALEQSQSDHDKCYGELVRVRHSERRMESQLRASSNQIDRLIEQVADLKQANSSLASAGICPNNRACDDADAYARGVKDGRRAEKHASEDFIAGCLA